MGFADVATVLFTRFLKFDAARPHWPDRDRFILSAGHGSRLLYSLLHLTGYADFPCEILRPPRSMAQRVYSDIRRWSVMPHGGHFAALEHPQDMVREIREFFRPLRAS
jgi:pimeloyl-ACP methyl ester carboxylesterase